MRTIYLGTYAISTVRSGCQINFLPVFENKKKQSSNSAGACRDGMTCIAGNKGRGLDKQSNEGVPLEVELAFLGFWVSGRGFLGGGQVGHTLTGGRPRHLAQPPSNAWQAWARGLAFLVVPDACLWAWPGCQVFRAGADRLAGLGTLRVQLVEPVEPVEPAVPTCK